MQKIRKYIIKYLIIIIGVVFIRMLIDMFVPELYTKTIVGDGLTQTETTFFGFYEWIFFNIIPAIIMSVDLYRMKQNWIVIPVLSIVSINAGLFFFAIALLNSLIKSHETI